MTITTSTPTKSSSPATLHVSSSSADHEEDRDTAVGVEYIITEPRTTIGRNTDHSEQVDVHVGTSKYISACHLEILHSPPNEFYLLVRGKNGIFANSAFVPKGPGLVRLPPRVTFRFPSTNTRLEFQSLLVTEADSYKENSLPVECKGQPDEASHDKESSMEGNESQVDESQHDVQSEHSKFSLQLEQGDIEFDPSFGQPRLCDIIDPNAKVTVLSNDITPYVPIELPWKGSSQVPMEQSILQERSHINSNSNANSIARKQSKPPNHVTKARASAKVVRNIIPRKKVSKPGLTTESTEYGDPSKRPPFTYSQLIMQAIISSHNQQLHLSDIYDWVEQKYPYYRRTPIDSAWQNGIRHNLSLKKHFFKVRDEESDANACLWKIDPNFTGASGIVNMFKPNRVACGGWKRTKKTEQLGDSSFDENDADLEVEMVDEQINDSSEDWSQQV